MTLPTNISKEHILKAIKKINYEGILQMVIHNIMTYFFRALDIHLKLLFHMLTYLLMEMNWIENYFRDWIRYALLNCLRIMDLRFVPKDKISVMSNVRIYEN